MHVPFLDPPIRSTDAARMLRSVVSGWLAHGKWTERFEDSLADHLGARHAVMISSGTAALHVSLALAGVRENDEVITSPMSRVATSNAILHQMHERRREVCQRYRDGLCNLPVRFVESDGPCQHACHLFAVRVPAGQRSVVRASLAERGIQTAVHYEPIHLTPYYRKTFGHDVGDLPDSERFGREILSLPTYATLSEDQQWHVIRTLHESLAEPAGVRIGLAAR